MNWTEIEKKYPKAFGKFKNRFFFTGIGYETLFAIELPVFNLRNLYDFFDEQGIHGFPYETGYEIRDKEYNRIAYSVLGRSFNRPKFEEALFEREFEILEERLK